MLWRRRVRSLAGIRKRTRVDVVAIVCSPDVLTSTASDERGAAFLVEVLADARLSVHEHREILLLSGGHANTDAMERKVTRRLVGQSLVVKSNECAVSIPLTDAVVLADGLPTADGDLPLAARGALDLHEHHGPLRFHEWAIREGDTVDLRALVEPASGTAYRKGGELVARPPIEIRLRSREPR